MKKLNLKKTFTMILSGVLTASAILSGMSMTASAAVVNRNGFYQDSPKGYYYQHDKYWTNVKHGNRNGNSMYDAGCGIFSLCNAVLALNGNKIPAEQLATWAYNHKEKMYTPGNGGLSKPKEFYNYVGSSSFASKYSFKVVQGYVTGNIADPKLTNHLISGGVAVIHVGTPANNNGHYMCITDYRTSGSKKEYYVIDSADRIAKLKGQTYGSMSGAWVSEANLKTSNKSYTTVNNYALISSTTASHQSWDTLKNKAAGKKLNIAGSANKSGTNVTVYKDDGTLGQRFARVRCGTRNYGGSDCDIYKLIPSCAPSCVLHAQTTYAKEGDNVNIVEKGVNETYSNTDYWIFEWCGSGYVIRSASNPKFVLTAAGTTNGSNVKLTELKGTPTSSQIWNF